MPKPEDTTNKNMRKDEIFTSWKEIASYLGKGVRTVQRWEHDLGLPVRRPDAKAKNTILLSRAELDAWVAKRWVPSGRQVPQADISDLLRDSRALRERSRILAEQVRAASMELVSQCSLLMDLGAPKNASDVQQREVEPTAESPTSPAA